MTHPGHDCCGWGGELSELEKGELPLSECQAAAEEAPHPPSPQLGPVVAGEWLIDSLRDLDLISGYGSQCTCRP